MLKTLIVLLGISYALATPPVSFSSFRELLNAINRYDTEFKPARNFAKSLLDSKGISAKQSFWFESQEERFDREYSEEAWGTKFQDHYEYFAFSHLPDARPISKSQKRIGEYWIYDHFVKNGMTMFNMSYKNYLSDQEYTYDGFESLFTLRNKNQMIIIRYSMKFDFALGRQVKRPIEIILKSTDLLNRENHPRIKYVCNKFTENVSNKTEYRETKETLHNYRNSFNCLTLVDHLIENLLKA